MSSSDVVFMNTNKEYLHFNPHDVTELSLASKKLVQMAPKYFGLVKKKQKIVHEIVSFVVNHRSQEIPSKLLKKLSTVIDRETVFVEKIEVLITRSRHLLVSDFDERIFVELKGLPARFYEHLGLSPSYNLKKTIEEMQTIFPYMRHVLILLDDYCQHFRKRSLLELDIVSTASVSAVLKVKELWREDDHYLNEFSPLYSSIKKQLFSSNFLKLVKKTVFGGIALVIFSGTLGLIPGVDEKHFQGLIVYFFFLLSMYGLCYNFLAFFEMTISSDKKDLSELSHIKVSS